MSSLDKFDPAESFDKGLGKVGEHLVATVEDFSKMLARDSAGRQPSEASMMAGLPFDEALKAIQKVLDEGIKSTPELYKEQF